MKRLFLSSLLLIGCGSPGGGNGNGEPDLAMMTTGAAIPDPGPGNGVDNNFGSVAGDDTPATAVPLGTSTGTGDINVWVNGNTTSSDGTDYFVFKTAAMTGSFTFNICWTGTITAMTATLWKVSGGHEVTPPIHQWTASGNCIMTGQAGDAALEASTEYLFGVVSSGGTGMYNA